MINLSQIARKKWQEKERERARTRNEQPPSEHLIPSPQSSTEVNSSLDSATRTIETNQENSVTHSPVRLTNVIQSAHGGSIPVQAPSSDVGDKINISAALLSLLLYVCSISLIVYGCTHLKDCPVQKMVTISYIAMGCLMLFSRILSSPEECRSIFKKQSRQQFVPETICRMCLNFLVQIATICLFFALCHWIFHMNPDFTEGSPNYCEKYIYKNTYYGCIVGLSLLGFIFLLTCCGVCILACKSK